MNWQGPTDDKTARLEDATLRVEQMDEGVWWWAVDFVWDDGKSAMVYMDYESDKESAMQAAEKAYKEHR